MSGPGPKDPPFYQQAEDVAQRALAAVAEAVGVAAAPVVPRVETTIAPPVATVEAGLVEAFQKMHAAEIAAIASVQAIGGKVALIMKRFTGNAAVDAARAKLEQAVVDFEAALKGATG